MRAVAEAIEYSPATIYLHFENKDALVEELCKRDFSVLLGQMAGAPLPRDPVERLRALGRVYAQFGLQNPNHYRFMFMTAAKFIPQQDRQDPGQQTFGLLRSCVEDLMAEGVIPRGDVDEVGHVLWATLHGAVALLITYRADQFPYKPVSPRFLDRVMDTTLAGLRASAGEDPATIH
jgi:AcrR family transcriptional regulator